MELKDFNKYIQFNNYTEPFLFKKTAYLCVCAVTLMYLL